MSCDCHGCTNAYQGCAPDYCERCGAAYCSELSECPDCGWSGDEEEDEEGGAE